MANPAPPAQMLLPVLPWWRVPMVWLVIGGPVSVIVACAITAGFVLAGSDTVVHDDPAVAVDAVPATSPRAPALQGRNHVAASVH